MAPVPAVGRAFSPLDEQLGLDGSDLTPQAQEVVVRLASWLSFAQAATLLEALVGVRVSRATARRQSEAAGMVGLEALTEQAEQIKQQTPQPPAGEDKQLMSSDGAVVPLVGGVWAEVKTLALAEVTRDAHGAVCTQHPSYFSRLTDAQTFQEWAVVETQRRGLESAGQVAAVQDGAEWLHPFVDYHRPDALRILDFAHAAEYVSEFGQVSKSAGAGLDPTWLQDQLHTLKHEGPSQVLKDLGNLQAQHPDVERLGEIMAYLQKREAHMQYPTYQASGWPIGSGMVESANKVVVEARLKGAGRHWERANVNPLLVLRNAVCNDRWEETWQIILTHRQQRRRQRQMDGSEQRLCQAYWHLLVIKQQVCATSHLPEVVAPPVSPAAAPAHRASARYSWHQPFLRRPPSPSPVVGGIHAKL